MNTATPENNKKKSRMRMIIIIACVAALVAIITAAVFIILNNTDSGKTTSRPRRTHSSVSPEESGTDADDSSRADQEHSDSSGALETDLMGFIGNERFSGIVHESSDGKKIKISYDAFYNTENGMMYFACFSNEFAGGASTARFEFYEQLSDHPAGNGIILVRTDVAVDEMFIVFDNDDAIFPHLFTNITEGGNEEAEKWANDYIARATEPITAEECAGTYKAIDYDYDADTDTELLILATAVFDEKSNAVTYRKERYKPAKESGDDICVFYYEHSYWAADPNYTPETDEGVYFEEDGMVCAKLRKSDEEFYPYNDENGIRFDFNSMTFVKESVWTTAYLKSSDEGDITYEELHIETLAFTDFGTVTKDSVYYVKYDPKIEHFEDVFTLVDGTCWAIPGIGFPSSYGTYAYSGDDLDLRLRGNDVGSVFISNELKKVEVDSEGNVFIGGKRYINRSTASLEDICIEFDIPYERD